MLSLMDRVTGQNVGMDLQHPFYGIPILLIGREVESYSHVVSEPQNVGSSGSARYYRRKASKACAWR